MLPTNLTITGEYEIIFPNNVEKGKRYTIELEPHSDHGNKTKISGELLGKTTSMTGDIQKFGIEDEDTREVHMFNPSQPSYKNYVKKIKKVKAIVKGLDDDSNKGLEDVINSYLENK